MKKWIMMVMGLSAFSGWVSPVAADEMSELKQQIAEQAKQLQQMQNRLEQLESSKKAQDQKVCEKMAKAQDNQSAKALPDNLKWIESVKINGDLRYRHESIDSESKGRWSTGRNRHRIRARLGLEAEVNDEVDLVFRIASGSADPSSTNQTLDGGFSSKDLWLDLAFFNWHPATLKGLNLYGGKVKNPFYKVGNNQLIWDDDLNPEGISAQYVLPLSDQDHLFVNGGGFWAEESGSGVDQSLWGAQAYLKHHFESKDYVLAGASYFDYGNTQGHATLFDTADSYGNTVDAAGLYVNDYNLVEGFAEYGTNVAKMPLAFFGNYVQNVAAETSEDTGWLVGCKLNKAKEPGSWELSYNWRELQEDAVIGVFTDSDFIGGGTGGRGHQFGLKYQLAKHFQTALTYFLDVRGHDNDDYRRLQADLIFKF